MVLTHQLRIEKLSDTSLIRDLESLVQKEKTTTLDILIHLNEVEKRSLHLSQGYSSLFDYCTRHLGYSESAASRRIRTARCIRDYPRAYELVAAGDVTLSAVSMIAGILTPDIADKLLFRIVGKSQREVEAIVSVYRPRSRVREKVTPVTVMKRPPGPGLFDRAPTGGLANGMRSRSVATASGEPEGLLHVEAATHDHDSSGVVLRMGSLQGGFVEAPSEWQVSDRRSGGNNLTTAGVEDDVEQRYKLEFAVDESVMEKIERVKSLMSGKHPTGATLESVVETMADEYLDRHSPEARDKRREARRAMRAKRAKKKVKQRENEERETNTKQAETIAVEPVNGTEERSRPVPESKRDTGRQKRSRHIPASTRDAVYKRDSGKCAFVGTNGKRCNSTWALQIDHIKPFAKGGPNTASNLRLLCGRHNRLAAERVFGKDFMERHYQRE